MDGRGRKILLRDLNAHLICVLCGGYYIDATSISECLHSFCKSCIVKYLETNKFCPICDVQLHKAKPLLSIKPDKTLQSLVYKMVPGLYSSEMQRRRQFYLNSEHESSTDTDVSCDQALQDQQRPGTMYYSPEDSISLSLEYYTSGKNSTEDTENIDENNHNGDDVVNKQRPPRRYLQCPAGVKMYLLKKFLRTKYSLAPDHKVDIIYADECLPDEFSLMDVAYTFMWNRATPMRLSYRIFERTTISVPVSYMGPTTSPQPTVTSDYPESTQQNSTHNTNDDDSSKGRQLHGGKRQLMESDSEAETSSHRRNKSEINKESVEPSVKKMRINSKKANQISRKKVNNYFKSPDRRKASLKILEKRNANKEKRPVIEDVHSDSENTCKESNEDETEPPVPSMDVDNNGLEENMVIEKSNEIAEVTLNKTPEVQTNFVLQDNQMDNDDLEEDDEDRLRISASEEDITQEDRVEDVVEPPTDVVMETPVEEEPQKNSEENDIEEDKPLIEVKREKIKKDVQNKIRRKNKKAKHHHHHRHHDRKRDHHQPPAATIIHSPDMKNDIMKFKVKLTAVKPDDQSKYYRYNNHSPTRHHNSKHKTAYVVSEESEKVSKPNTSNCDEDSVNSRITKEIDSDVKTNDLHKVSNNNSSLEDTVACSKKKDPISVSHVKHDSKNTESDNIHTSKSINSSNNNTNNGVGKNNVNNCKSDNSVSVSSNNSSNNVSGCNTTSSSSNNNNNSNSVKNSNINNSAKVSNNNNANNNSCKDNSINVTNGNNSSKNIAKVNENKKTVDNIFNKNRSDSNSNSPDKEKLMQMRAIRHKNIQNLRENVSAATYISGQDGDDDNDVVESFEDDIENEDEVEEMKSTSTILIPPSSITVSKITAAEKKKMEEEKLLMLSGKHNGNGLDIKRPSLEIMLVNAPSNKNTLKSSMQEEKQTAKVVKGPPPSIPLMRIQKANPALSISRQSMLSGSQKLSNKTFNKTSTVHNKIFSNLSGKDDKSKQRNDDEGKINQEKLTPNTKVKFSSQDDFGALDLSDKSSRKGSSSASSTSSENSSCPSPNSNFSPATPNHPHRPFSSIHGSPGSIRRSPSCSPPQICASVPKHSPETSLNSYPASMRNLLTLSDTAAHIRDMMAARDNTKNQLPSPNSQKRSPQCSSPELAATSKSSVPRAAMSSSPAQLKIPVPNLPLNNKALASRGRPGMIPNLNEITPGSTANIGRGKSGLSMQNNRNVPMSKPGPNQTVRHIPNPSVLLFRQQNQLKNLSAAIPSGPSSPGKKMSINGRGPNMPPPPPAIPLSTLRRMENMTRNIEKVASSLTVKAVVETGMNSIK